MEAASYDIILEKIGEDEKSFVAVLEQIEEFTDMLFEEDDHMEDLVSLWRGEIESQKEPCILLRHVPNDRASDINKLLSSTGAKLFLRDSSE
jgi:hypothetical protein